MTDLERERWTRRWYDMRGALTKVTRELCILTWMHLACFVLIALVIGGLSVENEQLKDQQKEILARLDALEQKEATR